MANEKMDFNKLFVYVEKLRLDEDKRIISKKLEDNEEEEKIGTTWDKFKISMNNFRKKVVSSVGSYETKNTNIDSEIASFKRKNKTVISEEEAKEQLLLLREKDENKLASIMFNVNVALDNNYDFEYMDEGLKKASRFINDGNSVELIKIRDDLERYYKVIADKSLSKLQKGILTGIAISSLAAVILIPVAAVGGVTAGAAGTTAGLAAAGFGDMQLGVGMLALTGALVGTAIIGGSYIGMKCYNEHEVKKQFRKLDADEVSLQLAIQCLLVNKLKKSLKEEEFKNRLDSILKEINMLKSDLDYYLFVEKSDVDKNRDKIVAFHGFDLVLEEILGI